MEFKTHGAIFSASVILYYVDLSVFGKTLEERTKHSDQSMKDMFKRLLYHTDTTYFPWTTPTTRPNCPYPCTHLGQHYCHPLPCYINCVDGVKPPGGCCYVCPNGPTCDWNGMVIKEGEFITTPQGQEVHCITGSYDGGYTEIRNATTNSSTIKP